MAGHTGRGHEHAILVESADYIYNLIYMTTSRFPPALNIAVSVLTFATPPFLFVLVLARSRRRGGGPWQSYSDFVVSARDAE